jgi:Transposase DDE domain
LLRQARWRGLQPAYVLGDSWYAAAQILNLLAGWGWHSGVRMKSNRKFGESPLHTTWPHRYGHAQGELRGVAHPVLGVKDGRRYWGTNDLSLTPRAVKAHYSHRQQVEETFWLLKQEVGWGNCSCQKQQAQWAHLHLGLYDFMLTQQTALRKDRAFTHFDSRYFYAPSHKILWPYRSLPRLRNLRVKSHRFVVTGYSER